jgi:quercetin dioxygenase-like cupin family protein
MKAIDGVAFVAVDWTALPATVHPGVSGQALWRETAAGEARVRMVEYSPGYVADHWCRRGHILLVLEGELETELEDGRTFTLSAGHSYHVGDGLQAHRSRSRGGARLFIVD